MSSQLPMSPPSSALDTTALYKMSIDDITSRLIAMQQQEDDETSSYARIDYLSSLSSTTTISEATKVDHISSRSKMAQWSYQLTDMTSLSRLAVSRSMNYLDRYLVAAATTLQQQSNTNASNNNNTHPNPIKDKRYYQLLSMTCLYISIKLYEPLSMDASLLSEISAGCYTTKEILDMESNILNTLSWKVNGVTSQEYVSLMLGLLDPTKFDYDMDIVGSLLDVSKYQCELSTLDYDLSTQYDCGTIALASILNSMEVLEENVLSSTVCDDFLSNACDILELKREDMKTVMDVQVKLRRLFCQNNSSLSSTMSPRRQEECSSSASTPRTSRVDQVDTSRDTSRRSSGNDNIAVALDMTTTTTKSSATDNSRRSSKWKGSSKSKTASTNFKKHSSPVSVVLSHMYPRAA